MPSKRREVSAHLKRLSRDPFRDLLTRWLTNGPTPEQIRAQAAQYPDRWAQGAAILGRLAGFSERTEIEHTGEIHHVHHLSDAELDARIAAMDRARTTVIDTTAREVEQTTAEISRVARDTPASLAVRSGSNPG